MTKTIHHTLHIACPITSAIDALTSEVGIQSWWTKDASIENGIGTFKFNQHQWSVKLSIQKLNDHTVVWKCSESNIQNTNAWEGSVITFSLKVEADGVLLDFVQSNHQDSPCYERNFKGWKFILTNSLKKYLEGGSGEPYPELLALAP